VSDTEIPDNPGSHIDLCVHVWVCVCGCVLHVCVCTCGELGGLLEITA